MWDLSINVMLFDHFRGHFAISAQKSSFPTGVIRVFATRFLAFEKPRFRWFYKAFRHGGMSCGIYL